MIRKLRIKFIAIIMFFVTLILLSVFGVQIYSSYVRLQENLTESFQWAFQYSRAGGNFYPMENMDLKHTSDVITIEVDSDYEIVDMNSGFWVLDEDSGQTIVDQIKEEGSKGTLKSNKNIHYKCKETDDGYIIVLVDVSKEMSSILSQVRVSVEIGSLAFVAFFALAYILSGWILKPVEQSWNQQKQFVADASHELKTPLTVILADSDILLKHKDEKIGEQKQWIDSIKSESLRMKKLVEDLLFLAKHDANKIKKQKIECDLSDIAFTCTLPFETMAYEKGLLFDSEIEEGLKYMGDMNQLKQFMMIFLDNAIKYTPKGEKITYRLYKENGKINMSILNGGSYIASEEIPHLFERFYRCDKSRVFEGGYGLGLAIAKEIADTHHITMNVKSSKEKGTCFSFVFEG